MRLVRLYYLGRYLSICDDVPCGSGRLACMLCMLAVVVRVACWFGGAHTVAHPYCADRVVCWSVPNVPPPL